MEIYDMENKDFIIEDGVLEMYLGAGGDVIIPDNVTDIGYSAFENCTGLTSITIPDSVTRIGDFAFNKCTGLTSITVPESVTEMENSSFAGCTGLTEIIVAGNNPKYHSAGNCLIETDTHILVLGCQNSSIPSDGSVTEIGELAFTGCKDLSSITIPDSVTEIGEWANRLLA